MYASIPDALRALARKIGADANGRNEEEILNNIVVKLGGTPVTNHGVAGSIGAMTKVVDLDVMHNMTTLNVTPTTTAQSITPESPVDGYSSVSVSAVTAAIDSNITAGNIKDGVTILGVEGSMTSGAEFSATPTTFTLSTNISNLNASIPNGVTSIGSSAFANCSGLKSVEIPSSVTSISSNSFLNCSGLTTITVHKAEDSITGAPWGAPNATVIWDG